MTPDSLSPPSMTSRASSRIRRSSSLRPATWPTTLRYSITRLTWRTRMSSSSLMTWPTTFPTVSASRRR
eukprot:141548-Pleurochrysis_carterae.AAC.1